MTNPSRTRKKGGEKESPWLPLHSTKLHRRRSDKSPRRAPLGTANYADMHLPLMESKARRRSSKARLAPNAELGAFAHLRVPARLQHAPSGIQHHAASDVHDGVRADVGCDQLRHSVGQSEDQEADTRAHR